MENTSTSSSIKRERKFISRITFEAHIRAESLDEARKQEEKYAKHILLRVGYDKVHYVEVWPADD